MGCASASRAGCPDSVEIAKSGTTLLQSLASDSIKLLTEQGTAKVRTSSNVKNLLKALGVEPTLIKFRPSQGKRLHVSSLVPSHVFLDCIESAGRFDPDTARSPLLYSEEMRAMLSGSSTADNTDNSILCLTYLAGSINRIVSKLQRERELSAIKLTEKIERESSRINESLQEQITSTDVQFKRTLETTRLFHVRGGSERNKKLIQDGIDQFQFVSSELQAQREQVVAACTSLTSRSAEGTSVESPFQSWCARYHLVSAGQMGYDILIECLMCWVALAISTIPHIGSADEISNHRITQAGCVLVMTFKEHLSRERTFLAAKSRSLMLEGGNAEKVFSILDGTRTSILNAMMGLVSSSQPEGREEESPLQEYLATIIDLPMQTTPTEKTPPIADMMRKFRDLQAVLRDEEKNLPPTDAQCLQSPHPSLSQLEPSTVYMAWFTSTQHFFDLIELSLSGLMRHFALSVPADTACFPVDLDSTVPMATHHASPKIGELKGVGSCAPVVTSELCDLSEGRIGEIMDGLRQKRYTRVVALVGAGISVAAGVPDFRSPGGLYDQMRSQGFEHPMQVFTAEFLRQNPWQFYKIFSQIRTEHLSPTRVHNFIRSLDDQGCLLRCYTQNIDGLERKAGLPAERLVEAHGTMCEARCSDCGAVSTPEALWAEWEVGQLPRCASQGCTGLLRPCVVFFGESLHERFRTMSADDLSNADLVIIIGTSLSVEPFASLVQKTPRVVPRLLINRHVPYVLQRRPWELLTPSVLSKWRPLRKDASILGECDDIILQITRALAWESRIFV